MKRLLPLLLCLCVLLSGCAGGRAAPAPQKGIPARASLLSRFPASYDLTFRLEAFQGDIRTSYSQITAVQTADGFYYAASTGERYLFLRQETGAYALLLWDPAAEEMTARQDLLLSASALAGFQDALLHLGLLVCGSAGLTESGIAQIAGRPCRIYQGSSPAGDSFFRRETCWIDQATGLTLSRSVQYTDRAGRTFTYLLTCEHLSTEDVALPETPIGPETQNGNTTGDRPAMFPLTHQQQRTNFPNAPSDPSTGADVEAPKTPRGPSNLNEI